MAAFVSRAVPPLLVCVGDLIEDVVVWTRGPVRHATDNPSTITRVRGGSAANVATFAVAQVPTRFIGRVGDDELGDSLTAQLTAAGVDVRAQRIGRTGSIVILVDEHGERTMYPDRAAAADLASVDPQWLTGAAAVHAPAYCLATTASRATTIDLLIHARDAGAAVSLDAASMNLLNEIGVGTFLDVVRSLPATVLFANAAEARLLELGHFGPGQVRLPGTTVVVKNGSRPVELWMPDGRTLSLPVPSVPVVRDTTGAGDAFAAGYLAGLLRGADELAAARAGSLLAASVLAAPGATSGGDQARRSGGDQARRSGGDQARRSGGDQARRSGGDGGSR